MGPIADRTLEHLGISDTAIARIRRLLLQTLKDHAAGKTLRAPIEELPRALGTLQGADRQVIRRDDGAARAR